MYKELVKEYLKKQGIPTEQEFNHLFPNLKELDIEKFCENYDPEETNIISTIINIITDDVFYVIESWEKDKSIEIEISTECTKKELNKYIKLLQDNGWEIDNIEEVYDDFEEMLNWNKTRNFK